MQFNTDLLQTLSLNTQKVNPGVEGVAAGTENVSGEFLSLLTEAKELAKSGAITPNEFIASLGDESLNLNPTEKKALAKSFMDFMPQEALSEETQTSNSLTKTATKEESSLQSLLGTTTTTKSAKAMPKQLAGQQAIVDTTNASFGTQKVESEVIDPKIANGKLLSLKAHKATKAPVSSAQDFVMQNQALGKATTPEQTASVRKSFFPKSKSQINAFNKEQNTINKSVFAGKNPFSQTQESALNTNNITTNESALFTAVEGVDQESNLQNLMTGQSATPKAAVATTVASSQVLDLSSINPQNSEQIISKISDYITTSRLENQESVDLLVKHESLGQFKVTASKGALPDQVNLEIAAASEKGKIFFQENEVEMIKNLSKSGVKLGDVKVALTSDSSAQSFEKNDGNSNQNNNGFNSKSNQQFASGRQESGRERREELWNLYRERLGA
jgi:flagellar hook-length control protein FliK